MLTRVLLDGDWQLTGLGPEGKSLDLAGSVPGFVHLDLMRAGRIPDPFWCDQTDACQWVEDWDWIYSREFEVAEGFDRRWAVLELGGLDTFAEVALNGETLGETASMFVPHRFEVGGLLRPGTNRLEVRFTSYRKRIAGKPLDPYPAAFFTSERVHVRRMQCTFGWDWVHRFVSAGIWRPVTLTSYDAGRLQDVFVYTEALEAGRALLKVQVEVERREADVAAHVSVADPDGRTVWRACVPAGDGATVLSVPVEAPRLWWPNGHGDQPLYQCRVALIGSDDRELDGRAVRFGIRTVELEEIADAPGSPEWEKTRALREHLGFERNGDAPGSSFTLKVNGERIFCKGGNWVPPDPFPSRVAPEHYDRLIRLARDGSMNLLRAWGGGIYEPEAFWEACDRHGVMVSQDFQMACARYPEDDPEFMALLKEETAKAIPLLRNHPSLAWWAGDNECAMNHDADDPGAPGMEIARTITGPLCRELDPSRPFWPTSPYRGKPNTSLTTGDCHHSAWYPGFFAGDGSDYRERIRRSIGRFMSEYAICGAPPMRSLLKFMAEEDVAAPDGRIWELHTKNNPHSGMELTHYRMLQRTAETLFGPAPDVAGLVRRMEYVPHEWIRLTVEAARREKWYCSGIQFWMYNDCWPASGWSLVDYYGFPKAGYYAMRRASKPLIASIEDLPDALRVWVCSDLRAPAEGDLHLHVQPWSGRPRWEKRVSFAAPANTSQSVLVVPRSELEGVLGVDSILVCNLASAAGTDRAVYYPGMPRQMELPPAKLSVVQEGDRGAGRLLISTDTYARVVSLDADLDFSDSYFDLLPGETKVVEWSDPSGAAGPTDIPAACWNAAGGPSNEPWASKAG